MALSKYDIHEKLGKGCFGEVYRATEKSTGTVFAIKYVENFDPEKSIPEVSVLRRVAHVSIIEYVESFFSNDGLKLCIVMEFADRGTLENVVEKKGCCTEEHSVWRFVSHIASALNYLHTLKPQHILHRDLKPANVLGKNVWSEKHKERRIRWKIADFGIAKLLNKNAQGIYYGGTIIGTFNYMAPEVNEVQVLAI
jgi:serine/threonine protein kinase